MTDSTNGFIEVRQGVPDKALRVYCFECDSVIKEGLGYFCAMDREVIIGTPNPCKLARSDKGLCGEYGDLYEPKQ